MKKEDLKPLSPAIQICDCGKVDAYKDDGHDCIVYLIRRRAEEASECLCHTEMAVDPSDYPTVWCPVHG